MAYRSQPHAQPPKPQPQVQQWSPQVVDQLLFAQFVKGEDVELPPPVANPPPPIMLSDSLRALNRYVNAPSAAKGGNAPGTPSRANAPTTPRSPMGGVRRNAPGGPRTPTAANKGPRPLPVANPTGDENSPTHSSAVGGVRGRANDMPAPAKKGPRSERRVPWPAHVPTDQQLVGKSRSQLQPTTVKRLMAQEHVDPDWIFAQRSDDFPITKIFGDTPEALKLARAMRDASGDWRADTFTEAEEMAYKDSMGFAPGAPSQAKAILAAVEGRIPPPQRDF